MSCECTDIIIVLGEKRKVDLKIWMKDRTAFTPTTATYTLYKDDTVVTTGNCTVTPETAENKVWRLQCLIEPSAVGEYKLVYRYMLSTEILIRNVFINVIQ